MKIKDKSTGKEFTPISVTLDKNGKMDGVNLSFSDCGHTCHECGSYHPSMPQYRPLNTFTIIEGGI